MSIHFKNLQVFSLSPGWTITAAKLEQALSPHPLLPCAAASMQSQGWLPLSADSGVVYSQAKNLLIKFGIQQKLLPAAVINHAAKQKAAALEKQQGFAPGRKQLRDLKEQVADELRPRAFVREKSVHAWIDQARGRFIVDTPTPKVAEAVATLLRTHLGEFPVTPLATQKPVAPTMTAWLGAGSVSAGFVLDQDCELIGSNEAQAAVRYVRHGLDGTEIRSLIKGGKLASRLGLIWRDRLSFVLTDKFAVKRIRLQAMKLDADDGSPKQNEAVQFEAGVTLMTAELIGLLDELLALMGGVST